MAYKGSKKQRKKQYNMGDTTSIRLTEVAGATNEVIDWLNSVEEKHMSADIIDAIKIKIALEQHYTKSQIERLAQGVNATTMIADQHKKDIRIHTNDDVEDRRKGNVYALFDKNEKNIESYEEELFDIVDKEVNESYEEELFEIQNKGTEKNEERKHINQGMKAFKSIKNGTKT